MPPADTWEYPTTHRRTSAESTRKATHPSSLLSGRVEHIHGEQRSIVWMEMKLALNLCSRAAEHLRNRTQHRSSSSRDYSVLSRNSSQPSAAPSSPTNSTVDFATAVHPTLSNATKLEVVVGDHESANPYRLRQFRRAVPDKDGNQSPVKKSALSDSTVELNEIKQSVERLRAQRTHVEQLRQSNERLKVQLGQQHKDNTRLRGELTRYQAMEQENIGLLQTIKLLEERSRTLESMCQEKRVEFRKASEELAQVEQERDQLLLTMEGIEQDHAETIKIHVAEQTRLRDRIVVLERKQDNQLDERVTRDREWSEKLKSAENKLAVIQQEHEQELKQCRDEKRGLNSTIGELEDQVQKLLATTVRQTAIIEDCDRALSESKKQHSSATENYQDQCQANSELTARVQQLEAQLASNQASWNEGNIKSEKIILVLESKLSKRRDKLEAFRIAIQEKDKQLQEAQRDQLVRDRNRYHSDEVNKELKKREQILQSEISELRLALQDVTDEKNILGDRIFELQERLETEQKDRHRWATARLKLLAEFCDEENKLTSALHHHLVWGHGPDSSARSDDSKGDERRPGSIVFG